MSQSTIKRGWLKRLLGGVTEGPGTVEIYSPEGVEIGAELQALRQSTEEQGALIERLSHQLRLATKAQSALAKRAQALADDWPDLYKRYFTKLGDEDRSAGRRTRTKRKPKRRS